jgi:poly-gamma-glutamate capsule biosynthesis protein CapA/YwtB (metallophosphatase superfamily)
MSDISLQLAITGDVMLGRLVNSVLSKSNYAYVWGDTIDIIRNADLSLINLECVIASTGTEWNKTFKVFNFRAHPEAIEVLKAASIDYASLANNHTLDYDIEALIEMLNLLDRNKIAHSGAGRDLNDAMKSSVLRRNSLRIGVVSLTDNQPEWEATTKSAGINYIPITLENNYYDKRLKLCIYNAKIAGSADIVIVSSHIGPHFREIPSAEYVSFAHRVIDLGADIYWGHSNHMPQGIEIYKNKLIMYDCGDFIDDYAIDAVYRNDLSFIFLLNIDQSSKRLNYIELVPTKIWEFKANMLTSSSSAASLVINRMVNRCNSLGTHCNIENGRIDIKLPAI